MSDKAVIIEVQGGEVIGIESPEGLRIEVHDYDLDRYQTADDGDIVIDSEGGAYLRIIWSKEP